MDSRASTTQSQVPGRRYAAIVWVVAILAVLTTIVPNVAEACPTRHTSSGNTGLVTVALKTTHIVQVTAVSASKIGVATRGAHCCGVCGHGGTAGCGSGCCVACSTAIDAVSGRIELPDATSSPGLSIQGKIVSPEPPPDFRPPRLFA